MSDLIFDRLTVRNFLRYGDRPTTIDISGRRGLVVIRGENGHGKSSVFDALSFALTGKPMRQFPMGALVNNVNKKKLEVTVDLRKGPWTARISRGQKPGYVRFWKKPSSDPRDIELEEFSETSGRGATDTAKLIEDFLGFDNALFCSMIAGSTRRPSFLASDSSAQKAIVERLFGFSVLQDDAAAVKTAREIEAVELARLRGDADHRSRQIAVVEQRIEGLTRQSAEWSVKRESRIDALASELDGLRAIDLDAAAEREELLRGWDAMVAGLVDRMQLDSAAVSAARVAHQRSTSRLETALSIEEQRVSDEDLEAGAAAIDELERMTAALGELTSSRAELLGRVRVAESEQAACTAQLTTMTDRCDRCGQPWPDADSRRKTIEAIRASHDDAAAVAASVRIELDAVRATDDTLREQVRDLQGSLPWPSKRAIEDARSKRDRNADELVAAASAHEITATALSEAETAAASSKAAVAAVGDRPPHPDLGGFASIADLTRRMGRVGSELAAAEGESDPFLSGIDALRSSVPDPIDEERLSLLVSRDQAARALERLLTHKDSPLRAAILARFLPTLNDRVTGYLDHLGLPYAVRFTSDLEVQILDGDDEVSALSGGEEERLAMALSWSFRDIYEEIHGVRVCFSAIDERLDSGMDAKGADAAVDLLRRASLGNGRSVWLVTHRPELESHADHVLWVRRNNRFSEVTG